MASRSLGVLTLDIVARIGGYTAGLDKAEREAKKRAQAIERAFDGAANIATAALASIGAAGVAAFAVLNQQIGNVANFKDLEETTGASAESLASLSIAAGVAGTSVDEIANASLKLTKSLTGVDDESKAAGASLVALGLSIEEFKALDPVERIDALTKAFAKFEDGSEKSAVAMALFGKTGAEQLKVFKALEEQGGRTTVLTQQQIDQADAYADAQAKLKAEFEQFAQVQSAQLIPVLVQVQEAFEAIFKNETAVEVITTVLGAAVKAAIVIFQTLAVIVSDVGFVFLGVGREIAAWAAQFAALGRGDLKGFRAISEAVKEDAARARAELDKFQAQIMSIGQTTGSVAGLAAEAGINSSMLNPKKPTLNFGGAVKDSAKAKKEINDAEQYLKRLQDQYITTLDLTTAEKALIDIREKGFKGLTPQLEELILAQAKVIDQDKEAARLFKERQDALDEVMEAQRALSEEGIRIFEQTRTPLENLNSELRRLNDLQRDGVIDWDTYKRAVEQAQDAFTELGKKGKEPLSELDEFTKEAARNIQGYLGDALFDAVNGNFKDIGKNFTQLLLRMGTEAAAANIAKKLFGDYGKDGDIGGIFGQLGGLFGGKPGPTAGNNPSAYTASSGGGFLAGVASLFSGFFAEGGRIPPGHFGVVGENGPELAFGGPGGMNIQPNGGSRQIIVQVQAAPNMSRDTAQQQGVAIGSGINRTLSRNT